MPARLKINFLTPLPPLPTEIANHSAALLPALSERAEVTAWTDQESWTPLPDIPVRRFVPEAPPFADMNRADATFFNLGNNPRFHAGIYSLARQSPGIVILHDTNLQNFFAHFGIASPEMTPLYVNAMRRWYGPAAEAEAIRLVAGQARIEPLMAAYPLTLEAAERAVGIVTHNQSESRIIARSTRLPVYYVPLAFDLRSVPRPRAPGSRSPPWRLLVFGFLGGNRRLPSILRALAGSPYRDQFALDIYGTVENSAELEATIHELGLQAQVKRHGFVSRPVLEAALSRADLAINLRNPTMGEASASQLHLWAHSVPTLVSRIGWYADLPSDTVVHVDTISEVEDLQEHLASFVRNPAPFVAAGRRGHERLLAMHGTHHYADALVAIAGQSTLQHGRRAAIDMARAATGRLLEMTDRDAFPLLARPIAEHIAALVKCCPENEPDQ